MDAGKEVGGEPPRGRWLCIFKRSDFPGMRRPGFTTCGCIENAVFYNVYFNFRIRAAESRRLLIRLRGRIAQTRNSEGESSPSKGAETRLPAEIFEFLSLAIC